MPHERVRPDWTQGPGHRRGGRPRRGGGRGAGPGRSGRGDRGPPPGGPAGRGGAVVNIASVAATIAFPGIAVYSATKSAVDRLTRVAAMESGKLGYAVRVNCIYPGLVPTAMGAGLANDVASIGLFASPEEAVGAVVGLTPSG